MLITYFHRVSIEKNKVFFFEKFVWAYETANYLLVVLTREHEKVYLDRKYFLEIIMNSVSFAWSYAHEIILFLVQNKVSKNDSFFNVTIYFCGIFMTLFWGICVYCGKYHVNLVNNRLIVT